mgnify:CR=1 FL=1|tara:strand:+ start:3020 stop:3619 length:600 start_codon:yes stop_codon:yes gene_type:complete
MKMNDMNGNETQVNSKNFYDWQYGPLSNNHIYGGYRDIDTGEIYLMSASVAWRGTGVKLFDTNRMQGKGMSTWSVSDTTLAQYSLARLRKITGKKVSAFEKVNVMLKGTSDYNDRDWERRGFMPNLEYSIKSNVSLVCKTHMTPSTYKKIKTDLHRIYYPIPWPLPEMILNVVEEIIVCEEGMNGFPLSALKEVELKVV